MGIGHGVWGIGRKKLIEVPSCSRFTDKYIRKIDFIFTPAEILVEQRFQRQER
jgi:hypothetical protein